MSAEKLVGMAKEAAIEYIKSLGAKIIISSEDEIAFIGTYEWVPAIFNLTIENGKVIKISRG